MISSLSTMYYGPGATFAAVCVLMEDTMGKVIAYIRRSKDDESGLSFAAQLAAIRECLGDPDLIYKDEGLSAPGLTVLVSWLPLRS